MNITFIQTGGTIDKDYPKSVKGWAFEIGSPAVERILKKLNPSFEYKVVSLSKKDSLEITNEDRDSMVRYINDDKNQIFIITHGTDTMIETGRYLKDRIRDKTIIITGAMRPEKFSDSDAPINIGIAIGSVQCLQSGVYIAMHGLVRTATEIARDLETGQFK